MLPTTQIQVPCLHLGLILRRKMYGDRDHGKKNAQFSRTFRSLFGKLEGRERRAETRTRT